MPGQGAIKTPKHQVSIADSGLSLERPQCAICQQRGHINTAYCIMCWCSVKCTGITVIKCRVVGLRVAFSPGAHTHCPGVLLYTLIRKDAVYFPTQLWPWSCSDQLQNLKSVHLPNTRSRGIERCSGGVQLTHEHGVVFTKTSWRNAHLGFIWCVFRWAARVWFSGKDDPWQSNKNDVEPCGFVWGGFSLLILFYNGVFRFRLRAVLLVWVSLS